MVEWSNVVKAVEELPPEISTSTFPRVKLKILQEVFKLTQVERDHFDILVR